MEQPRHVYVAGSVSLAVLEVLVHLGDAGVLSSYSLCAVEFEDSLIEPLDRSRLPAGWRLYLAAFRTAGDR